MKHLQHVSGVRPSAYWLSTLTIDALHCAIVITIVVILFAAFQLEEFSGEGLGAVTVVMVKVTCTSNSSQYLVYVHMIFHIQITTCLSGIPLIYLSSFIFSDGLIAYAVLIFVLFFLTSQVCMYITNTHTFVHINTLTKQCVMHNSISVRAHVHPYFKRLHVVCCFCRHAAPYLLNITISHLC